MRIFAITKAGLIGMTLAVSVLWGCLAMERREMRHARIDLEATLRMQNQARGRMIPAAEPSRSPSNSPFWRPRPSAS